MADFANSTPVYLPAGIAGLATGVVGLTNTVRDAEHVRHVNSILRAHDHASATTSRTRVLHRQREHPAERLRRLQPEPAGSRVVRHRRDEPGLDYRFGPSFFFHDITGAGHIAKNNGLFPAVRGYDLATGAGTPKMYALITGLF